VTPRLHHSYTTDIQLIKFLKTRISSLQEFFNKMENMIRSLDSSTVRRISSGQVITKVEDVVKELIE